MSTPNPTYPEQYSTAIIEDEVTELERSWTYATQTVADETRIFSRTFSNPSFSPDEPIRLETILLDSYSEKYKGNEYYLVTSKFSEDRYSGAASLFNPEEDFLIWYHTRITYRMEKVYSTEEYKKVTWLRQSVTVPGVPSEETPDPEDQTYYYTLSDPFYLPDIDAGKGIMAEVICADPVEVYIFTEPTELELVTGRFQLLKRYIKVKLLNPTAASHTKIEIIFYGKLLWTQQIPVKNEKAPAQLVYPVSTPYEERLLPPGVTGLRDSFWNTATTLPPAIDQAHLRTSVPEFIPGTGDIATAPIIPEPDGTP